MLYASSNSEDNESTVETLSLRWHHAPITLVTQKGFMLRGVHCSPPTSKHLPTPMDCEPKSGALEGYNLLTVSLSLVLWKGTICAS